MRENYKLELADGEETFFYYRVPDPENKKKPRYIREDVVWHLPENEYLKFLSFILPFNNRYYLQQLCIRRENAIVYRDNKNGLQDFWETLGTYLPTAGMAVGAAFGSPTAGGAVGSMIANYLPGANSGQPPITTTTGGSGSGYVPFPPLPAPPIDPPQSMIAFLDSIISTVNRGDIDTDMKRDIITNQFEKGNGSYSDKVQAITSAVPDEIPPIYLNENILSMVQDYQQQWEEKHATTTTSGGSIFSGIIQPGNEGGVFSGKILGVPTPLALVGGFMAYKFLK